MKWLILNVSLILWGCAENLSAPKEKPLSKDIVWIFSHGYSINSQTLNPVYSENDSAVYFGKDRGLIKFDAATGKELWRSKLQFGEGEWNNDLYSRNLSIDEEKKLILYDSFDGLGIVNSETGENKFSTDTLKGVFLKSQSETDFIFANGKYLYKLNKNTFRLKAIKPYRGYNPFVEGNRLYLTYFGYKHTWLEVYDTNLTETYWTYADTTESRSGWLTDIHYTPLFDSDYMYILTKVEGSLAKLDKHTGKLIWKSDVSFGEPNSFVKTNDVIFLVDRTDLNENAGKGVLYGFDANNGALLWKRFRIGAEIMHPHAYKGYFYFVDHSYIKPTTLTVIDPQTGIELYRYDLPKGIPNRSIGFGQDMVFIAGFDESYALKAYHKIMEEQGKTN